MWWGVAWRGGGIRGGGVAWRGGGIRGGGVAWEGLGWEGGRGTVGWGGVFSVIVVGLISIDHPLCYPSPSGCLH